MPRNAIIELPSRRLVVLDPPLGADGAPVLPEGGSYAAVVLSNAEAAKLTGDAAGFTVAPDGTVTVLPLSNQEQAARGAEAAAAQERSASLDDLRTTFTNAMTRLTAIADDPTATDTNAEVRQAVVDMAGGLRRVLRYLKAQAG